MGIFSAADPWPNLPATFYRGADNSLARPTSRFILFDGETILFDASLVIHVYINSTNIPPVMIIKRIYENQNLLSLSLVSFLVGLRTYQHPCSIYEQLQPFSLINSIQNSGYKFLALGSAKYNSPKSNV